MRKLYIAHRKKVFVCLLILAAAALGFAGGRQSMEKEIPPVPSSRTILELRENAGMIELYGLDCDMVSLAGPSSLYMANLRFVEPLRGERTEASATLDEASGHITVSITMDRGAGGALTGPQLTYTADCQNSALLSREDTPYEGETVPLTDAQMLSLAKLSAELLQACQAAQQVSRYWM